MVAAAALATGRAPGCGVPCVFLSAHTNDMMSCAVRCRSPPRAMLPCSGSLEASYLRETAWSLMTTHRLESRHGESLLGVVLCC